jgi:hypothetical protein
VFADPTATEAGLADRICTAVIAWVVPIPPGNIPSGRSGAVSWTDAKGNLWLFGGSSYSRNGIQSYLNDLWEFNPSTNEWAWMGGASVANQLTLTQIVRVLKRAEVGVPVAEVIRKVGIEKLKRNPEQEVGFMRAAGYVWSAYNVQTPVDAADHRRLLPMPEVI